MSDEEQPKNVKELLVELKDASELMVDLAYAAVFFNEDDLAEEVEELEERMDAHLRRLREVAMLAARSPEDAEAMAGVLHIAAAIGPGDRCTAAHRARPRRRHPRGDEERGGGRGWPGVLRAAVPGPGARRRGGDARGPVRRPARRARVLGAEGGAGGAASRRA